MVHRCCRRDSLPHPKDGYDQRKHQRIVFRLDDPRVGNTYVVGQQYVATLSWKTQLDQLLLLRI